MSDSTKINLEKVWQLSKYKNQALKTVSFVFYLSVVFFKKFFLVESDTSLKNLTLEKHFMKLSFKIKNKLYIKKFEIIFFYPFNTIIKLYMNNYSNIDIPRSSFSGIPPFYVFFWGTYLCISYKCCFFLHRIFFYKYMDSSMAMLTTIQHLAPRFINCTCGWVCDPWIVQWQYWQPSSAWLPGLPEFHRCCRLPSY